MIGVTRVIYPRIARATTFGTVLSTPLNWQGYEIDDGKRDVIVSKVCRVIKTELNI